MEMIKQKGVFIMREIHIDLSSDYYLQQPKVFGGYVGEHNESKLIVKLPDRMIRDDISYYYFEFQTVLGEHITSPNVYKNTLSTDNEISIIIWEQLLPSAGNLNFCVNAINLGENDTVTVKGKTSICTLCISESPTGEDVLIDTKSSKEELQKSIDSALKEAKDSGEFKGDSGANGKDGTSVTVSSVSESTADGGENIVTFSDGKTLTVKNGSKGSQGEKGEPTDVQQTTGQSTTAVMSQKATTDEIDVIKSDITDLQTALIGVSDLIGGDA